MNKKYVLYAIFLAVLIYIFYRNTYIRHSEIFLSNDKKQILKLKFGTNFYIGEKDKKDRFHFQSENQFIEYFLPNKYDYVIVNSNEKSDITIWDIHLDDNSKLSDDEINIMISIENVPYWNMYNHYKKYDNYNDDKIHIYMYNHIDKLEKTNKYLSIPLIHNYINYYKNNINLIPSEITLFQNKKFCLMINKSKLNPQISETVTALESVGKVDSLSQYPELTDKSCYHSIELLNVFNKYKFIVCFENSYANGYITEKIFNCFYAKTIPIYKGSEKISDYINQNSFIDARSNFIEEVNKIKDDENLYNNYINSNKISDEYYNENYETELIKFIDNK